MSVGLGCIADYKMRRSAFICKRPHESAKSKNRRRSDVSRNLRRARSDAKVSRNDIEMSHSVDFVSGPVDFVSHSVDF